MNRINVTASIHLHGEPDGIDSRVLPATNTPVLHIGPDVSVFVHNRAQAEALFDAVAELTMVWRERDPEVVTVDATITD